PGEEAPCGDRPQRGRCPCGPACAGAPVRSARHPPANLAVWCGSANRRSGVAAAALQGDDPRPSRRSPLEPMMAAVPTETILLAGLDGEVEILIDRWGIPHIYAKSEAGAFFAQGFNAGRDRLWQIDMWRKRGLGLTAGDLGPDFVARDRAARLLLYRGDMAA